jgi:hypothetical protein
MFIRLQPLDFQLIFIEFKALKKTFRSEALLVRIDLQTEAKP